MSPESYFVNKIFSCSDKVFASTRSCIFPELSIMSKNDSFPKDRPLRIRPRICTSIPECSASSKSLCLSIMSAMFEVAINSVGKASL